MTQTNIPNSDQIVLDANNLFTTPWFIYLQGIYKAIRGKLQLNLGGTLSIDSTSAANTSSSATDLISYTLGKNSLQNNGDVLEVKAWGIFAANANNKQLEVYFGSQLILDTGLTAINGGSWEINSSIIRKSPTSQEIITNIISSNSSVPASATRTSASQDIATDIIIKCTGTGSATDDIIEYALIVNLFPNT